MPRPLCRLVARPVSAAPRRRASTGAANVGGAAIRAPAFVDVSAPTDDELHAWLQTVVARLMKLLMHRAELVEQIGNTYLAEPDVDCDDACPLRSLQAAAITYRIAFGPRAGQVSHKP
ncbi:MAG: hypothetical protein ACRCTL_11140 [Pseudomonas sp.]